MRHFLFLFVSLAPVLAWGCFGPKLYIGAGSSAEEQALYALVRIYVQEKTGTESELVPRSGLPAGILVEKGKADLEVGRGPSPDTALFRIPDRVWLVSGPRPTNDLQFSLVPRALHKLQEQLTPELFDQLVARIVGGEPPLAAARAFLRDREWF